MRNRFHPMVTLLLGASIGAGACLAAGAAAGDAVSPPPASIPRPAAAPIRPVTETLWGRKVTDNYRYMEKLDASTIDWMKAQGAYTRSVLDSIAPLDELRHEVAAFSGSIGLVQGYVEYGGRAFFEERAPGSDNFDLIVSDHAGRRKLVDLAALRAANGGKPYAINYFLASPDGSKVAVGISEGGSEDAVLTVYLAATGAKLAGPIDRAQFGATSWSEDSKTLYFVRLKKLAVGDAPTEKYQNSTADAWDLKGDPVAVLGTSVGHGPAFKPAEFPAIQVSPGSPLAAALSINGVQNELAMWVTPVGHLADPQAVWTPLLTREDGVTGFDMRGSEIFLLSHKDAPTFQVLSLQAGQPLASASVLVPAKPDRVIEGIHAAADALYVRTRRGAYSELLRIPKGTKEIQEVALPLKGHAEEAFSDPRAPGLTVTLSSWVVPGTLYAYHPASKTFQDLKIGTRGGIDSSAFIVSDLDAPAPDGVKVPLSLVQPKDPPKELNGPQIAIIEAYGSYGISELADFSVRRAAAMSQGITYGVCHVRGGGELGEEWRLGGKDSNKHHTWEDLIACAEYLIGRGTTAKDRLFIIGGSAGGITVGRAITERPDLFAGAVDMVPAANTLRAEFTANGPPNVPEFGSVSTQAGFDNLYAMDTIAHIKKGTQYPSVMVSTGLNDPRVSPWEPAKVAAALQASGSSNPVLLRIDQEAGHGIGSTRSQTDLLTADWIAFAFWRSGLPAWQPRAH
jgi:prolyl oligopeptidase